MAFAIGYNVSKANELMNKIADTYNRLGIYTEEQWSDLINKLRTNWVGEDEQDFEKKLADRICNLYVDASNLAEYCVDTIGGLAKIWHEFQIKNTLNGKSDVSKSRIDIDIPKIKKNTKIVKFVAKPINNNEDRGLRDASSKANIQEAVNTFVGQIKNKTDELFQEVDVNTAFYGDQSANIKSYVEKVGSGIYEVTIAIKDMYEGLERLANSNYTASMTNVGEQMSKVSSDVDSELGSLGNSRWS